MRRLKQYKGLLVALVVACCAAVIVWCAQAEAPASAPQAHEPAASSSVPAASQDDSSSQTTDGTPSSSSVTSSVTEDAGADANDSANASASSKTSQDDGQGNEQDDAQVSNQTSTQTTAPQTTQVELTPAAQREVQELVPHVEPFTMPAGAEYEPQVVLIGAKDDATVQSIADDMVRAGVTTVDPSTVERVTNGLFKAKVAGEASVADAVNELNVAGVGTGAEPNYVLHIMDDEVLGAQDEGTEEDATYGPDAPVAPQASERADDTAESGNATAGTVNTTSGEAATEDAQTSTPEGNTSEEPVVDGASATQSADETTDATGATAESTSGANPTDTLFPNAIAKDVVNDTLASSQWGLNSIDAADAWNLDVLKNSTTKVGVAVIDNGFNAYHEDLVDNVVARYNAPNPTSSDVSAPGNADHGTHVAGIVGAISNNGVGISGVGNNHVGLALVRTTNSDGVIYTGKVADGIEYAITNKNQLNIHALNLSVGMYVKAIASTAGYNALLKKIDEAKANDIVVVASAGNSHTRTEENDDGTTTSIWTPVPYVNVPSDYKNCVSVINLRNTNSSDPKSVGRSSSSNYNAAGETSKNISAPGTDILSTFFSGYGTKTGTSMASPHVAGVVGLMFSANPSLTAEQAVNALYESARDIGTTGWDEQFGHGEVNALAAVEDVTAATMNGPEYLAAGSDATYSVESTYLSGWEFASSAPEVLSVDATSGQASAHACGIATVTATSGNITRSQEVVVFGGIQGNPYVAIDGSEELAVQTPESIGALSWDWTSSDAAVATVTSSGVVYGHATGTASITATLTADPSVSFTKEVSVYDAVRDVQYLAVADEATPIAPSSGSGDTGSGFGVIAESSQQNTYEWTSSNMAVATVDNEGNVTRVGAGYTSIACKTTYANGTYTTTVWPLYVYGPLAGSDYVACGGTTTFAVDGLSTTPEELQQGWQWSSNDQSVAVVDATTSKVTGVSAGTATITATRGEGEAQVSYSREVRVVGPIEGDISMVALETAQFEVSNANDLTWVWESSDTNVAVVNADTGMSLAKNPGSFHITARLSGNNDVVLTKDVEVTAASLEAKDANNNPRTSVTIPAQVFTGSELTPVPEVTYTSDTRGILPLTQGCDYTVSFTDGVAPVDPDTYVVTITGIGAFTGSITANFVITTKEVAVPSAKAGLVYDGTEQVGVAASEGYTVEGGTATNAGEYSATVSLIPGYVWKGTTGDATTTDKTIPWSIAKATLTATYDQTIFVGEALSPTAAITGFKNGETSASAKDFVAPTVTIDAALASQPGAYAVTPEGGSAANYDFAYKTGALKVYERVQAPVAHDGLVYNGRAQTGVAAGNGYALSGTSVATNAGSYTVVASLVDKHHMWADKTTTPKTYTWSIARKSVPVPVAKTGLVYNGGTQTGVAAGTLYTLSGTAAATNAGTYAAVATLVSGNYAWADGTTTAKRLGWSIGPASIATATITSIGKQAYTGKAVRPTPVVRWGTRTLAHGTDYVLSYKNNVRAGQATVIATGKGNFAGTRSTTFSIVSPKVSYRVRVQRIGWQGWRKDGKVAGTQGKSLRMERLDIKVSNLPVSGGIRYRTYVQKSGWQSWRKNGALAGTNRRRMEVVRIALTGKLAKQYDVWYRVRVQGVGWMGWAKNGAKAGTMGYSQQIEGIQVVLRPKGSHAPAKTYLGVKRNTARAFLHR